MAEIDPFSERPSFKDKISEKLPAISSKSTLIYLIMASIVMQFYIGVMQFIQGVSISQMNYKLFYQVFIGWLSLSTPWVRLPIFFILLWMVGVANVIIGILRIRKKKQYSGKYLHLVVNQKKRSYTLIAILNIVFFPVFPFLGLVAILHYLLILCIGKSLHIFSQEELTAIPPVSIGLGVDGSQQLNNSKGVIMDTNQVGDNAMQAAGAQFGKGQEQLVATPPRITSIPNSGVYQFNHEMIGFAIKDFGRSLRNMTIFLFLVDLIWYFVFLESRVTNLADIVYNGGLSLALNLLINISLISLTIGRGIYKIGRALLNEKITAGQNILDAVVNRLPFIGLK